MIQPLYTEQQRQEILQKQILMHGGSIDVLNKNQKKLSVEEVKRLEKDYRKMYFGLTAVNWSQGMTLGMAWQKALQQIEAFVQTKTKIANHPVNAYLNRIHAKFKRDMSKHIMDCKGKESETKLSPKLKKIFAAYGTKEVQTGKSSLNDWYQKYMPEQTIQKIPDVKKFEFVKQNIQQSVMLEFLSRNRAA